MNIILCATEPTLAKAWSTFCGEFEFVTVVERSIVDIPCDAIVSPANSFGFMDGGIDALYLSHFGKSLQSKVQSMILEDYAGELLVGQAYVVETNHEDIPFLIVAPTMRVPMKLFDSVNPYLAVRAVLLLLKHGRFKRGECAGDALSEHINTVAIPGLGTGVGQISPNVCAKQVSDAIRDVWLEEYAMPKTWAEASERHQLLYTHRPKRLQ